MTLEQLGGHRHEGALGMFGHLNGFLLASSEVNNLRNGWTTISETRRELIYSTAVPEQRLTPGTNVDIG